MSDGTDLVATEDKVGQYIRPKDIDNRAGFGQHVLWNIESFV